MPTKKLAGYLLLLLGAAVFYYAYYGWFATFLLWLLILLPAVSLLISFGGIRRTALLLSAPETVEEKGSASLTLTLRAGRTAGRVEAILTLSNLFTGQSAEELRLTRLRESQSLPFDTGRCGCVEARIQRLYACDLLGLFRFPIKKPEPAILTVLPRPYTRRPLPDPVALVNRLRPLVPKAGGGFAEDYEYREYRPGDPTRSIHWKLTAKMGTPILREGLVPRDRGLILTPVLQPDPGETMAVLRLTAEALTGAEIPFLLCWQQEGRTVEMPVADRQDWRLAVFRLLSSPADGIAPAADVPHCVSVTEKGVTGQ